LRHYKIELGFCQLFHGGSNSGRLANEIFLRRAERLSGVGRSEFPRATKRRSCVTPHSKALRAGAPGPISKAKDFGARKPSPDKSGLSRPPRPLMFPPGFGARGDSAALSRWYSTIDAWHDPAPFFSDPKRFFRQRSTRSTPKTHAFRLFHVLLAGHEQQPWHRPSTSNRPCRALEKSIPPARASPNRPRCPVAPTTPGRSNTPPIHPTRHRPSLRATRPRNPRRRPLRPPEPPPRRRRKHRPPRPSPGRFHSPQLLRPPRPTRKQRPKILPLPLGTLRPVPPVRRVPPRRQSRLPPPKLRRRHPHPHPLPRQCRIPIPEPNSPRIFLPRWPGNEPRRIKSKSPS